MLLKRFALGKDVILNKLRKGDEIRIAGKEQRHLRASRVAQNENVELFDSAGSRVVASVRSIDSASTVLTLQKHVKEPSSSTLMTLAVGMPKGSRSDWLVEKVTECGISALIPLEADRNVLKVKDPKMERWQRLMTQASKQSLTRVPPVLRERMDTNELLTDEISNYDTILWGCMPQETQYKPTPLVNLRLPKRPVNALLIIGPEGDLSTSEKNALSLGLSSFYALKSQFWHGNKLGLEPNTLPDGGSSTAQISLLLRKHLDVENPLEKALEGLDGTK